MVVFFMKTSQRISAMISDMDGLSKIKKKIGDAIIRLIAVFMVDDFFRFEISSKIFLHNKAVFKNVSLAIRKWMIFFENLYVSISDSSASLPKMIFGSRRSFSKVFSIAVLRTEMARISFDVAWIFHKVFLANTTDHDWHIHTITNIEGAVNV
jgi:hypothetical protein